MASCVALVPRLGRLIAEANLRDTVVLNRFVCVPIVSCHFTAQLQCLPEGVKLQGGDVIG